MLPDLTHRPLSEGLDALIALDSVDRGYFWTWAISLRDAIEAHVVLHAESAAADLVLQATRDVIAQVVDECGACFDTTPETVTELCERISAAFTRGSDVRAGQERELNELRRIVAGVRALVTE